MDKETRSAIERATQRARRILEEDFAEQLQGDYDIMLDGRIGERAGAHLIGRQKALRSRIVAAVEHKRMAGMAPKDAVADYLRDAAFTTLNRFVALKMLEARGLVQECITKGDASSGFINEYLAFALGAKFPDGSGYQLYIESIFDELSTEVKVLFDRRDPASALWPRRAAFEELLEVLNAKDLCTVWAEDETIGWVYQYFNSGDERRKMRDESQAPRNSRELAIRNQFFTPSYVVQFLSDNTLGRIWYEMRKGDTQLGNVCEYMVRQVDEVFADEGAPAVDAENVVQHRPSKDPRDLRVIDPACGSGHFLLYCFLLLLIIYEEAWKAADAPASDATGKTLRQDYPEIADLRRAIPALILGHNLHGVDIDPRCAQIAQLALWMRAQRAYHDLGVARPDRPIIRRSNIVIAEPMPGDVGLVEEFAATLNPPVLGHLFKEIVGEMTLAGEMGSLLPIERRLAFSIQRARQAYIEQQKQSAQGFLPGFAPERMQTELDLSGIDDDTFFEQAEDKIFDSLRRFVADAVNGVGARRRLFADDAEQGIALIDLCRKRFDVVLMNPPFGLPTAQTKAWISKEYSGFHNDIYAAFASRAAQLAPDGIVGCISSRSFLTGKRLETARTKLYIPMLSILWDLGLGVMDNAEVESAAVIYRRSPNEKIVVKDSRAEGAKTFSSSDAILANRSVFHALPSSRMIYGISSRVAELLLESTRFEPTVGTAREGFKSFDNVRFLRVDWEVSPASIGHDWARYNNGGVNRRFFGLSPLVVSRRYEARELDAVNLALNGSTAQVRQASDFWLRSGSTYSIRAGRFQARALPEDFLFSGQGPAILADDPAMQYYVLGWLNSDLISYLVHLQSNKQKYYTGVIKGLPWVAPSLEMTRRVANIIQDLYEKWHAVEVLSELSPFFRGPTAVDGFTKFTQLEASYLESERYAIQQINGLVNELYDISADDLRPPQDALDDEDTNADEGELLIEEPSQHQSSGSRERSWAFGVAIGRFSLLAEQKDQVEGQVSTPFAALPQSSRPRMVESSTTLMADDPGSPFDLASKLAPALNVVGVPWGDELRAWYSSQFFDEHIATYSSMRRIAPIYWQLTTSADDFSVWLHYPTVDRDTLFEVRNEIVLPRLSHEQTNLKELRSNGIVGRPLEVVEASIEAIMAFLDEIDRVAPLWDPCIADGVLINAAPLWRLFPRNRAWQKEVRATWDALVAGDLDWSSMALRLWPERVIPKCGVDRSVAIAHGLEDNFWHDDEHGKSVPRNSPLRQVAELIAEHASSAVKGALKSILEAPEPLALTKRTRKRKAS